MKKNKFYPLFIILTLSLSLLTGCSALGKFIGESKIQQGMEEYSKTGVSYNSLDNLISGLDYFPDSPDGVENLKKQYSDFSHMKNSIYNSRTHSLDNLKKLESYLVITEKIDRLSTKLPTLSSITDNILEERNKFSVFLDTHLSTMRISPVRNENIIFLKNYEGFSKFSNSQLLRSKIQELTSAVTIRYVASLRFNPYLTRYDLPYIFKKVSHENSSSNNRYLDRNYIQFLGNLDSYSLDSMRDVNLVQIDISSLSINTTESKLLEKSNASSKFFREDKTLTIRGTYKLFNSSSRNLLSGVELNVFEVKKEFSTEIERVGNGIRKSDEKEVVEEILERFFYEIIRDEIPSELNRYYF